MPFYLWILWSPISAEATSHHSHRQGNTMTKSPTSGSMKTSFHSPYRLACLHNCTSYGLTDRFLRPQFWYLKSKQSSHSFPSLLTKVIEKKESRSTQHRFSSVSSGSDSWVHGNLQNCNWFSWRGWPAWCY